jgi:hypothetical protein
MLQNYNAKTLNKIRNLLCLKENCGLPGIMNFFLLISIFFLTVSTGQSGDSWEISRGKKIIVKSREGDSILSRNISLKDTSAIVILYREVPSNITWKRNFILRSDGDSVLQKLSFEYSSGVFRLPISFIGNFLKKYGSVTLVTEQHPSSDDIMIRSKMQILAVFRKK